MCGISGYAGLERNESLLKKMTAVISHRGPDNDGLFFHDKIGMGMRRLSIIDTATGRQPIFNEDKSVVIVFNGEIYNYKQLMEGLKQRGHQFSTHSDTETIVHLYEEKGIDCIEHLRGMFAFALYDIKKETLFLVRDRVGIKPLYYFEKNGQLLFGSEIKSLLEFDGISKEAHLPAIDSYLKLRYIPGPETIFSGVHKLPAGHWMSYQNGTTKQASYWDPAFEMVKASEAKRVSDQDYRDRFSEVFQETMKLHLESDVPVGSYLSGGLDSSLITAEAAKLSGSPVETFCVGFDWGQDETINAREVASSLGCNYNEVTCKAEDLRLLPEMIWHYDEPIGDPIALPTFLLSRLAQKKVKVVLTGEGADEVLAGYLFHRVLDLTRRGRNLLPSFLFNKVLSPAIQKLPVHLLDSIFDYPAFLGTKGRDKVARYISLVAKNDLKEMYEFLITLSDREARNALYLKPEFFSSRAEMQRPSNKKLPFLNRALLLQYSSWLPDNILARQDKMSMANSVEARVPFLDHKLIEFLMSVPPHLKLNSLMGNNKILARQYASQTLPPQVSNRRKKAFYIPTETYFSSPVFKELIGATLSENQLKRRGYFNPSAVRDLVRLAETGNEFMAAKQVFSLISLELWHQIFLEGNSWR